MKFRRTIRNIITDNVLQSWYCIEVLVQGKWGLLGDENGPMKFKSKDERDKEIAELKEKYTNTIPKS